MSDGRLTEFDLAAFETAPPEDLLPLALALRSELVRVYREHYATCRACGEARREHESSRRCEGFKPLLPRHPYPGTG